jgi:hypothetical protein
MTLPAYGMKLLESQAPGAIFGKIFNGSITAYKPHAGRSVAHEKSAALLLIP